MIDLNQYDLLIFDLDGTITALAWKGGHWLPGRRAFFSSLATRPGMQLAIATNQGGTGLRHLMEIGNFGEPNKYAPQAQAEAHVRAIAEEIGQLFTTPAIYIAFRYQSQKGNWAPIPQVAETDPRWSKEWRKPAPGMLLQAMADAGATPSHTLMVGDQDSDRQAAEAAGCHYMDAEEFFNEQSN